MCKEGGERVGSGGDKEGDMEVDVGLGPDGKESVVQRGKRWRIRRKKKKEKRTNGIASMSPKRPSSVLSSATLLWW